MNPTTSANSTVASLRSSTGVASSPPSARAVPQWPQNRFSWGLAAWQDGQLVPPSAEPHPPQYCDVAGFAAPQDAQAAGRPESLRMPRERL